MQKFEEITYEVSGPTARITINRPHVRNALSIRTRREITSAVDLAETNREVKVIVITGTGDVFSAGADVSVFREMTPSRARSYLRIAKGAADKIENSNKPVLAAVNGYALGGGCEIVLACDMAIASDNARFGQPEIKLGLIPGVGGTQRLPRLVGLRRAKELILTGAMIDAAEALRIGLVNRVVPRDRLMPEVESIAAELASYSPLALTAAKDALNRSAEFGLTKGLAYESGLFASRFSTEDTKEGVAAFLEKRKPNFAGK